jgi:CheY-like chemotaxis protein
MPPRVVVGDRPGSGKILAFLLRALGLEVHTVQTGLEVLTSVRIHRPDAILLGMGLLGAQGVARQLRRESFGRPLVVAVVEDVGELSPQTGQSSTPSSSGRTDRSFFIGCSAGACRPDTFVDTVPPMSRSSSFVSALLAFALTGCGGTDKPADPGKPLEPERAEGPGKVCTSAKGGFSVAFPAGATDPTEQEEPGPAKVVTVRSSLPDTTSLVVTATSQPAEASKGDADAAMLDAVRNGLAEGFKGKAEGEEKLTLDGHPGRSFRVAFGDNLCRVRAFVGKGRLYQVMVLGPRTRVASKEADQFLDSFKIIAE